MGRSRNKTVFSSVEGDAEEALLEHLKSIYSDPKKVNFTSSPTKGGDADKVLGYAINEAHSRKHSFAWFDEDKPLGEDSRKKLVERWNLKPPADEEILTHPLCDLQNTYNSGVKNPIVIVSRPICLDALILRILKEKLPHEIYDQKLRSKQILDSKNALKSHLDKLDRSDLKTLFKTRLTRDHLEKVRVEIFELDLLIKIISPP